jgi:hypothetical protein
MAFKIASLLGTGILCLMAYKTKPTDESFKKFINNKIHKTINNYSNLITDKKINVCDISNMFDMKDYILFKYAIVDVGDNKKCYIGAFNKWI